MGLSILSCGVALHSGYAPLIFTTGVHHGFGNDIPLKNLDRGEARRNEVTDREVLPRDGAEGRCGVPSADKNGTDETLDTRCRTRR